MFNICTYITSGHGDEIGSDVVSLDTSKKLGEFCSDSCMVSIMSLAEVREYNPEFDKELGKYCYSIIKNFEGEVELFEMEEDDGTDQRLYFVGKGKKISDFLSTNLVKISAGVYCIKRMYSLIYKV